MSNVLGDDKRHQVVALGRLGWSLRRIEDTTGVRRETISGYLRAAGVAVRGPGRRSESKAKPAISPPTVSTDSDPRKPAITLVVATAAAPAKTGHSPGGVHRPHRGPAGPRAERECV